MTIPHRVLMVSLSAPPSGPVLTCAHNPAQEESVRIKRISAAVALTAAGALVISGCAAAAAATAATTPVSSKARPSPPRGTRRSTRTTATRRSETPPRTTTSTTWCSTASTTTTTRPNSCRTPRSASYEKVSDDPLTIKYTIAEGSQLVGRHPHRRSRPDAALGRRRPARSTRPTSIRPSSPTPTPVSSPTRSRPTSCSSTAAPPRLAIRTRSRHPRDRRRRPFDHDRLLGPVRRLGTGVRTAG